MKKLLLLLLLVTLVACNQSEDDMHDSQEWSSDTVPNPEDGTHNSNSEIKNNSGSKSESKTNTPFKKEEIAGEWEVELTVTNTNCEDVVTNEVISERWFINFETSELNITVMTKGSKVKEYWGYFTGKNLEAIADKKLTKQEMTLLNSKNTKRNTLNLVVDSNNLITGNRLDISKDLCSTEYIIQMKR
ncbi:MAG: hypothetical protein WC121_03870 [Candidatus Kapaibacterium sp.]